MLLKTKPKPIAIYNVTAKLTLPETKTPTRFFQAKFIFSTFKQAAKHWMPPILFTRQYKDKTFHCYFAFGENGFCGSRATKPTSVYSVGKFNIPL